MINRGVAKKKKAWCVCVHVCLPYGVATSGFAKNKPGETSRAHRVRRGGAEGGQLSDGKSDVGTDAPPASRREQVDAGGEDPHTRGRRLHG